MPSYRITHGRLFAFTQQLIFTKRTSCSQYKFSNINLFKTKVKRNAFNGSNCMRLLWTYFCSFDYSFSCNTLIIICLWNASWSSHVEERLSTLSIHVSLRKKKKDRKKRGRKYNLFYISHKRSSIVRSPGGQKLSHARNKRKAAMTASFACAGTFFATNRNKRQKKTRKKNKKPTTKHQHKAT